MEKINFIVIDDSDKLRDLLNSWLQRTRENILWKRKRSILRSQRI